MAVFRNDDGSCHGPFGAQTTHESARIDVGKRAFAVSLQVVLERIGRTKIAHNGACAPENQSGCCNSRTFGILLIDADIADVRIRERDNLSCVTRVSEDFLIPGHGGVKDHFGRDGACGAD